MPTNKTRRDIRVKALKGGKMRNGKYHTKWRVGCEVHGVKATCYFRNWHLAFAYAMGHHLMEHSGIVPVEFDVTPHPRMLNKYPHVHVRGVCVKNRFGPACPEDLYHRSRPMIYRGDPQMWSRL